MVIPAGWRQADGERAAPLVPAHAPTAVVAANDPPAIGLYLAFKQAGVRVPAAGAGVVRAAAGAV